MKATSSNNQFANFLTTKNKLLVFLHVGWTSIQFFDFPRRFNDFKWVSNIDDVV